MEDCARRFIKPKYSYVRCCCSWFGANRVVKFGMNCGKGRVSRTNNDIRDLAGREAERGSYHRRRARQTSEANSAMLHQHLQVPLFWSVLRHSSQALGTGATENALRMELHLMALSDTSNYVDPSAPSPARNEEVLGSLFCLAIAHFSNICLISQTFATCSRSSLPSIVPQATHIFKFRGAFQMHLKKPDTQNIVRSHNERLRDMHLTGQLW